MLWWFIRNFGLYHRVSRGIVTIVPIEWRYGRMLIMYIMIDVRVTRIWAMRVCMLLVV
jgi:hypothetical protein